MPVNVIVIGGLAALIVLGPGDRPQTCERPVISQAATVQAVRSYFRKRGRTVATFVGYSGAEYEDKVAMLARAATVLDALDPKQTIVNIGATADGIGAVYDIARQKGFETTGIVSTQARDTNATLAPCVGTVFFIRDASWGGVLKGTKKLSPTSMAMVSASDHVIAIGGGEVAQDEFQAARGLGKKTRFFPADMNHAIAISRAARNGQPPPTDFRGALGAAMGPSGSR
ncbi:MAG: hypothetical protein H0W08_15800 [Acidobacteria bacterium]|nr:hypothetical protein [Acidobacteriota bacterium]